MQQKSLLIILAVVLLCCCLLIAGAGLIFYLRGYSIGGGSGLEPLMINANDLPGGWESAEHYYSLPYREGTSAVRNDVFQYSQPGTNDILYLSHEIFLYPSEEAAAAGYQSLHDEEIESVLPAKPVDFIFAPGNPADQFDKFCAEGSSPEGYFCIFIQSHGKYVIELRAMFDNNALTAAQVDEVLRRLDARLP